MSFLEKIPQKEFWRGKFWRSRRANATPNKRSLNNTYTKQLLFLCVDRGFMVLIALAESHSTN